MFRKHRSKVFGRDASMKTGAMVSKEVGQNQNAAQVIWLGGGKTGNCTKLNNPFAAALMVDEDKAEDVGADSQVREILRLLLCLF